MFAINVCKVTVMTQAPPALPPPPSIPCATTPPEISAFPLRPLEKFALPCPPSQNNRVEWPLQGV